IRGWSVDAASAAFTALMVFWLTHFVGEDYRRWRDGKALAAALAGEVESFVFAMKLAGKTAKALLEQLEKGEPLPPRHIPEAPQSVYAANLQRLGLLGASIGRDLPFAYHMVYAYRVSMTAFFEASRIGEQKGALLVAQQMIANANDALPPLLVKLQTRARQAWRPFSS
ncbi:MAG TPA: hypothetical protein VJ833_01485, partial [Rhodanobacteraceae bacterium]|nr:hypothetical protein [Rhodanobacteraceae bacterium]